MENLQNINSEISNEKLLYNQALENRDEIKMQDINLNASKKNIDIANSAYYPTVYSHLEYGFNDDKMTLDDGKVWSVPLDPANTDYQAIQKWIAEGGEVIDNPPTE